MTPWQKRLRRLRRPGWLGSSGRTSPLSDCWGLDRGTPVDRHCIEHFLAAYRADIRGRVLEVKASGYDVRAAIRHAHRVLRPGGVLLASVPAVSPLDVHAHGPDCWRFTAASGALAFGEALGAERVAVPTHGNVRTAVAFLLGLASEELSVRARAAHDDRFPLVVVVRAAE